MVTPPDNNPLTGGLLSDQGGSFVASMRDTWYGVEPDAVPTSFVKAVVQLFDPDQCRSISQLHHASEEPWQHGTMVDEASPTSDGRNYVRRATVKPVALTAGDWVRSSIIRAIEEVNRQVYRYRLVGITADDPMTFVRYRASDGDYFGPHLDAAQHDALATRKLTFTVQLTDPVDYDGGQLRFSCHDGSDAELDFSAQGSLIVFPSYLVHEVTPLTRGTREVLVGWVRGPTYA